MAISKLDAHLNNLKKLAEEKIEKSPQAKKAKELACKPLELTKYRNERNLMLYPFCSTSKRKRLKKIEYRSSDEKRWLQVTANNEFGMVKIWDFDILRFAISKAGEIKHATSFFPNFVEFSAYECLKALNRDPESGKNTVWLKEALKRLSSTMYCGNIFRENETDLFTLITASYEDEKGNLVKIKINFNSRLLESIRFNKGLLSISSEVICEEAGIKKRLLELIKVSKGDAVKWTVKLDRLKEMCANEWDLKRFKFEIKTYQLPWRMVFSRAVGNGENITFCDY